MNPTIPVSEKAKGSDSDSVPGTIGYDLYVAVLCVIFTARLRPPPADLAPPGCRA